MLLKYISLGTKFLILITLIFSCSEQKSRFKGFSPHYRSTQVKIEHSSENNPEPPFIGNMKGYEVNASPLELKENYPDDAKFFFYTPNYLSNSDIQALSAAVKNTMSSDYKKLIINLSTEPLYDDFTDGFYAVTVVSKGKVEIIKVNSWFDKLMNYFYL